MPGVADGGECKELGRGLWPQAGFMDFRDPCPPPDALARSGVVPVELSKGSVKLARQASSQSPC